MVGAALALIAGCTDSAAPRDAIWRVPLLLAPYVSAGGSGSAGASTIGIDNAHIVVRTGAGTVVLDTVVLFPADRDELRLKAAVPVRGASEVFTARIRLRSDTLVLFDGSETREARLWSAAPPIFEIALSYVGPGSTAVRVELPGPEIPIRVNETVQLNALVLDARGTPLNDVPIIWSSSDRDVATVSATGLVTAGVRQGAVTITAQLFSGLGANTDVIVAPPASLRISRR